MKKKQKKNNEIMRKRSECQEDKVGQLWGKKRKKYENKVVKLYKRKLFKIKS